MPQEFIERVQKLREQYEKIKVDSRATQGNVPVRILAKQIPDKKSPDKMSPYLATENIKASVKNLR